MNLIAIARPYARAAFESALEKKDLRAWHEFLQMAATIAEDKAMQRFMLTPEISNSQLGEFFLEILMLVLNDERRNFIKLLAENRRLSILPAILQQFKNDLAAYEKTIDVLVTSATPLTIEQKSQITNSLTKRLNKKVILAYDVDPKLLGGAVIRAGDKVIDGSVRGKLNRLVDYIS